MELHISKLGTPLVPAVLPLIFVGCPPETVSGILWFHRPNYTIFRAKEIFTRALEFLGNTDVVTTEDLGAIHHSQINSSPERVAAAAEAILKDLINVLNHEYTSGHDRSLPQPSFSDRTPFELPTIDSHINALLFLLPKAGISEEIILQSSLWDIYSADDVHRSLLQKCLGEYKTRVRDEKLEELGRRLEAGN